MQTLGRNGQLAQWPVKVCRASLTLLLGLVLLQTYARAARPVPQRMQIHATSGTSSGKLSQGSTWDLQRQTHSVQVIDPLGFLPASASRSELRQYHSLPSSPIPGSVTIRTAGSVPAKPSAASDGKHLSRMRTWIRPASSALHSSGRRLASCDEDPSADVSACSGHGGRGRERKRDEGFGPRGSRQDREGRDHHRPEDKTPEPLVTSSSSSPLDLTVPLDSRASDRVRDGDANRVMDRDRDRDRDRQAEVGGPGRSLQQGRGSGPDMGRAPTNPSRPAKPSKPPGAGRDGDRDRSRGSSGSSSDAGGGRNNDRPTSGMPLVLSALGDLSSGGNSIGGSSSGSSSSPLAFLGDALSLPNPLQLPPKPAPSRAPSQSSFASPPPRNTPSINAFAGSAGGSDGGPGAAALGTPGVLLRALGATGKPAPFPAATAAASGGGGGGGAIGAAAGQAFADIAGKLTEQAVASAVNQVTRKWWESRTGGGDAAADISSYYLPTAQSLASSDKAGSRNDTNSSSSSSSSPGTRTASNGSGEQAGSMLVTAFPAGYVAPAPGAVPAVSAAPGNGSSSPANTVQQSATGVVSMVVPGPDADLKPRLVSATANATAGSQADDAANTTAVPLVRQQSGPEATLLIRTMPRANSTSFGTTDTNSGSSSGQERIGDSSTGSNSGGDSSVRASAIPALAAASVSLHAGLMAVVAAAREAAASQLAVPSAASARSK